MAHQSTIPFSPSPTTQDLKITSLLTSIPPTTLQTYLRNLVRSPIQPKDREQALLLLGMVIYKKDPPKRVWDNSLYEYVGLLGTHVRRCEMVVRQDLRTPKTRVARFENMSTTGGQKEGDKWEVVESMPKRTGPSTVPADGGKSFLESLISRPRTKSPGSTSPLSKIEAESKHWETIPLTTPKAFPSPRQFTSFDQIQGLRIEDDNQDQKSHETGEETPTVRDVGSSLFTSGLTVLKSITNAIQFPNSNITTPDSELQAQLNTILAEFNSVQNLQNQLKEVICGLVEPEKRKNATIILGILSFLDMFGEGSDGQRGTVGTDDCAAVYGYIPMMRRYIAVESGEELNGRR